MEPQDPRANEGAPDASSAELERLRELLLHDERSRLHALETKPEKRVDASSVGEVLPDAVLARSAQDDRLSAALAPTVERGLEASARKNPKLLADAIYPVLGPAIRKAIQAALAGAIENLNVAIENSLSPQNLRWRWEARRAGVPYAEYVLLRSLLYRVEQVFLIHRETGLLLAQAAASEIQARDPDMISGMMTAVTDFVRDSFGTEDGEGLQQVNVGGTRLAIAQGPAVVLAAVVRGTPPADLRTELEETLEQVHLERADALAAFDGDSAPFGTMAPVLEKLLREERKEGTRKRSIGFVLPAAALLLAFFAVREALAWSADRREWRVALERLDDEPGYVVVDASRSARRVDGLRDPLARPLEEVLGDAELGAVEWSWAPILALDPVLVERRARSILSPPAEVRLRLDVTVPGVLVAEGRASAAWGRRLREVGPTLPGVDGIESTALVDVDLEEMEGVLALFADRRLPASSPDDSAVSDTLALIQALDEAAQRAGRAPILEVRGIRDAEEARADAQARVDAFVDAILARRPRAVRLHVLHEPLESSSSGLSISALPAPTSPSDDGPR